MRDLTHVASAGYPVALGCLVSGSGFMIASFAVRFVLNAEYSVVTLWCRLEVTHYRSWDLDLSVDVVAGVV